MLLLKVEEIEDVMVEVGISVSWFIWVRVRTCHHEKVLAKVCEDEELSVVDHM
jgi:hypothetical protein